MSGLVLEFHEEAAAIAFDTLADNVIGAVVRINGGHDVELRSIDRDRRELVTIRWPEQVGPETRTKWVDVKRVDIW